MLVYILRRLALTIPVLIGVATLVFLLIHLVPGDPAQAMLGESAAPADLVDLRAKLGLDRPLLTQYVLYLKGLAHGDLGTSFGYRTPVSQEVGARWGRTAELALVAMVVAIVMAIPLGVIGALYRGRAADHVTMALSLSGIAMPNFWLGPLLALTFAVQLRWLPVSGTGTWQHLVLPAVTLGAALAAVTARMTRASLIDELREVYVLAARARGLSRTRAVVAHALRNSLIPVVTIIGLQLGSVLTGTIITETIFSWPGVGRLLIQAINLRDYPLVQGCILLIATTYVAMNLLVDLVYAWLDPRIKVPMIRRLAIAITLGVAIVAIVGPWIVPDDPSTQQLALRLLGPSWRHPLGFDELGRDVLARLLGGARISLLVAVSVVSISAGIGTIVGAVAGYAGGWFDEAVGRSMDVLLAFPGILLAIALVAVLGPSLTNVVIALASIGWVGYARLVRGQALKIRELDYVQAARALGATGTRVVFLHVVPATLSSVAVQAALGMASAIIAEASLSFLGLGVQPPTASWGSMLDAGRSHLFDAPHLTIFPGIAIAVTVLGFNFAGDALREHLDPRAI